MDSIYSEWICPITQMPMKDPVITEDGHTYQKSAILEWFYSSSKSPKTGLPLQSKRLIPNRALKGVIEKYKVLMENLKQSYKRQENVQLRDLSQFQQIIEREISSKQKLLQELKQIQKQFGLQQTLNRPQQTVNVRERKNKILNSLEKQLTNNENQEDRDRNKRFRKMIQQVEFCQLDLIQSYLNLSQGLLDSQKQEQLRQKMELLSLKLNKPLIMVKKEEEQKINFLKKISLKQNSVLECRLFQNYQESLLNSQIQHNLLLTPFDYLLQIFQNQRQIKARYQKNLQTELSSLEHQRTTICFSKFFKHDWATLKSINLMDCQIKDQDWRSFVQNANKLPNLREIKIYSNFITTLLPGDLQSFISLQSILFYSSFLLIKSLWRVVKSIKLKQQKLSESVLLNSSLNSCPLSSMKCYKLKEILMIFHLF